MCNSTRLRFFNGRYEDLHIIASDEHGIRLEQGDAFVVINRKMVVDLAAALVKVSRAKRPPNP